MFRKSVGAQILLVAGILTFLYATKYHLPFKEAIDWVHATDVYSYLVIAEAAPGFPGERISTHFSQRWMPHYLVGWLSKLLGLDIGAAYVLVNGAVLTCVLLASLRLLLREARDEKFALLLFLLLAFSAFAFRLNVFVPGLLADLVFVLGLTISLSGIASRRFALIVGGAILATTGKQMSILVLPGLALGVYFSFVGRFGKLKAIALAGSLCAATIVFYLLLIQSAADFAVPNTMTVGTLMSFFPWLVSDQFALSLLSDHLLRIFLPLLPFFLVTFLFPNFRARLGLLGKGDAWGLVLVILGPMAYAFFPGPLVQMGNQSRYMAATLLPLALLTIKALPDVKLDLRNVDYVLIGIMLCLISYHHRHSMIQSTQIIFLVVHALGLACLAGWIVLRRGHAILASIPVNPLPRATLGTS